MGRKRAIRLPFNLDFVMPRETIKPEKDDTHSGEEGNKFTKERVSDQRSKSKAEVKKGERDRGDKPKAKYLPMRSARSPI